MSKGPNNYPGEGTGNDKNSMKSQQLVQGNKEYLFSMSLAPKIQEDSHWFQMLPVLFFTAVVIMVTRMASYERPMNQFFWYGGDGSLTDFFSYYKMGAILGCAILAVVVLLYRVVTQSFFIKRSYAYIPMAIYTAFVLLSYFLSDYKEFSLWGWNDRFEGTVTLISYMVMLFFIINTVNTEKNVRRIVYAVALTSFLLALLGLSQALGHDFLQTLIGKKLITPSWFWDQLDNLNFTFKNREIYQTVYNINYVSFYLTLLIPLFGILFIRSFSQGRQEPLWRKAALAVLFTILIYNLIGSASSGGLLGMAFAVLIAFIVLNKKLLRWWRPVLILVVLTLFVSSVSYGRWMPELRSAINGVLGIQTESEVPSDDESSDNDIRQKIDYMETVGNTILISYAGAQLTFTTYPETPLEVKANTSDGTSLDLEPTSISPIYRISEERFQRVTVRPAEDEKGNDYIVIGTDGNEWPFLITDKGVKYVNGLGKLINLKKVPAVGWENNQHFGSGRGFIWSRTIPMMKETMILGHGADTYCIYFPQDDYVGRYNSVSYTEKLDIIVDKPHNMYMGYIIGTGGISMIALFALWLIYVVQSFILYRKDLYKEQFLPYTGVGIFLGICGFLVAGLVNDSSVSVMPMFYGLLGTGISINSIIKSQMNKESSRRKI